MFYCFLKGCLCLSMRDIRVVQTTGPGQQAANLTVSTVQWSAMHQYYKLEDMARYAGLLLAPAEGFGLRPRLFLPFGQKKSFLCCFVPFLAIFGVQ